MGLLLQDKNGIYDDTIIPHAYDRTIEAYMEADSALVHDGGVWREVWPDSVSAYVYGASIETVVIRKNGIVVAEVLTDANGRSIAPATIPRGICTLTGSISGYTEEQAIDDGTTVFRAMPEKSIYWYGNLCKGYAGGLKYDANAQREGYAASNAPDALEWRANSFLFGFKNKGSAGGGIRTVNEVSVPAGSRICVVWGAGSYFTIPESLGGGKYYGANANQVGWARRGNRIPSAHDDGYWISALSDGHLEPSSTPAKNTACKSMTTPEGSYYFSAFQSIAQAGPIDSITEVCAIWLE